jgi:type I restriction enzyme M protein
MCSAPCFTALSAKILLLYIEGGDDSINYADADTRDHATKSKTMLVKTKGYFIYPSQLFVNMSPKQPTRNERLNTDLAAIFSAIESSANGYPSERDIKGLFADFDTTSNRLGNTVKDKNTRLAAVHQRGVVDWLNFGGFQDSQNRPVW